MLIGGISGKIIWLALIGFVVLIFGGFLVYSTWKGNKKKVYSILLKLNNGEHYTITYGTLDFTVKVISRIRTCIAEKNEAKNYFVNKGNIQYISDNSIEKVCAKIFNGNIGKY